MDLWIRSQDKTKLMKTNEIEICQNSNGTWWFNIGYSMGEYNSKERALEVLDEIQNILMPKMIYKTFDVGVKTLEFKQSELVKVGKEIGDYVLSQSNTFVYEIPKE